MAEIATIDWFGRWGTSVFSENTAIFLGQIRQIDQIYPILANRNPLSTTPLSK